MFSATMPAPIEELARTILRDPAHVVIAAKQATIDLIEQHVCFVSQADKQHVLAELISTEPDARTIVFTRTKHGADRVVKQLRGVGISAEAIHGNKSQANRQRTLAAFKSSQIAVLVATDVAARGIDIDGVTHVFNFDLPTEPETYVHRVGRTGRAGAGGIAISLCNSEERGQLRDIERLIRRRIDALAPKVERRPAQSVVQPRDESRNRSVATLRHDRPSSQPTKKKRRLASIG
jgi:ATP-dependent RNA helicase RhlE